MTKSFYDGKTAKETLELYDKAHDNEYDKARVYLIKKELDKVIINWKNITVLEVGPGAGLWTKYFLSKGAKVTCVDLRKNVLAANKLVNLKAKFILGDATNVKLNKKFDLIFAKDIIEHIKKDNLFIKNMTYHLTKNGLLFISTQNSFSLNYLIEGIYQKIKQPKKKWLGWDYTHIRFYTYFSLRKKLKRYNFTILKTFGNYHVPYRFVLGGLLRKEINLKKGHFLEYCSLATIFPFNISGWSINIIAKKR